jgi:hypothetical protein
MTTAAYISSPATEQLYTDDFSGADSAALGQIEILQRGERATTVRFTSASVMSLYITSASRTEFSLYYQKELSPYLRLREKKLAEERGSHGSLPVSMIRKGNVVALSSSLSCPIATWPNGTTPGLASFFESLAGVGMKQYCGKWTLGRGYALNPLSPQYGTTADCGDPDFHAPQYNMTIEFDGPSNVTFYQFKTEQTAALDTAFEEIVNNWSAAAKDEGGSSFGAGRVADALYVITDTKASRILDVKVEDVLSEYLNPAITELFPYPRRIRR